MAPWNSFGFATSSIADRRHRARLGDVDLVIDESLPPGLRHLVLVGCPSTEPRVAGLPVEHLEQHVDSPTPELTSEPPASPLNIIGVDHVVVLADDVRATCAEVERVTGAPLKRVKEGERGVQGFHRLGSVILEVVERRLVDPGTQSQEASYWGFVIVVDDIQSVAQHLGPDVIGSPKPAVQPDRLIATVRSTVGLGVPLALMSR